MTVAEVVGQLAQRHAEGVRYPVPGVEGAACLPGFKVDEDGAGEAGQVGHLVVGVPLLGAEPGEFVPHCLVVRGGWGAGHLPTLAVNEP